MIDIAVRDVLLCLVIDRNDDLGIELFNASLRRRGCKLAGGLIGQTVHLEIVPAHGNRLPVGRKNAVDAFVGLDDRTHGLIEAVQYQNAWLGPMKSCQ